MPGWRLLGDVGSFYQNYQRFSLYHSAFCQLTLYHRPPLPLFSLRRLCDTELTCSFGGNMTLLSCDVKVATRLPKYIHARAGMEQGSRQTGRPHRWVLLSCRPVRSNEPLHASTPARSGWGSEVEEVTWPRGIWGGWDGSQHLWKLTMINHVGLLSHRKYGLSKGPLEWHNTWRCYVIGDIWVRCLGHINDH